MPRRVSLPGASELFRPTRADGSEDGSASPEAVEPPRLEPAAPEPPVDSATPESERRASRGSGRSRHDEKITVYLDSEELLGLEQSRLTLRARHALAVDRGRIVREAIAAAIEDLELHGADSELVRRLSDS